MSLAKIKFPNPIVVQGVAPFVATFTIPGLLVVGTGKARFYLNRDVTVENITAAIVTQPTGVAARFDVNYNGTTMFTTQGNRPNVAVSTNTDLSSVPDVVDCASGGYWTVDTDVVGSTVAGADAVIQIWYW